MLKFNYNGSVTTSPRISPPTCGATQFRWVMHCALPFVLPLSKCVHENRFFGKKEYKLEIHNHYDREFFWKSEKQEIPDIRLVPKLKKGEITPKPLPGIRTRRERLQSVAFVREVQTCATANEVFDKAERKIAAAFELLADHLSRLQRQLPYSMTWAIYPVSLFDTGLVHHGVEHFCPKTNKWEPLNFGVAISVARHLQSPLFINDAPIGAAQWPELDLADELLAEAKVSIFRSLTRLAVINSFSAVEILANSTYKKLYTDRLISTGLQDAEAKQIAEVFQKQFRNDEGFLFGRGLKTACGRSLVEENKNLYDAFLKAEREIRHQVAHVGKKPTPDEATHCHNLCCEVIRFLWEARGLVPRPMLPPADLQKGGFEISAERETYVCSPEERLLLQQLMGFSSKEEPRTAASAQVICTSDKLSDNNQTGI